ncbi:MAG: hypothetical protein ACKO8Q_10085, partial [Bacteroidota bacterium]
MQNELDSSIKPVEEKELKKKKLPRWLKIVLISVTSVISLLFLIVILLITVFEDEMVQYALSYFSKNIKTKSAVESAELSLWINFPSASIQFNNVYIIENSEKQDTLIKAEKMYASFDVIDLFSGKYEFEDFGIENGRCSFTVDKSGKENWDVWLSDSVIDNEGEKYAVAIENILTDKISFSYVNDSSKQNIQLSIQELVAEGAFTQDNFELSIDGKLKTKKIELNEQSFLKNKQFDLESSFEVDMKKSNLVFNKTNVTVEETPLVFAGNLSFGRNPEISCVIDPTEMNFVNIIDLLPEEIGAQFQAYEPSGIALFDLSMNGPFDNLNVKTNIQIKEASLKEINSGVELDNIEFTGAYNLSNGQDSIEIKSLAAQLGDGLVSLNGKILPSNEPFVNLKLETSSNLNDVKNFLSWDSLTTCNGSMKLQAEIVGKIAFDSVDSSFIWSNVNLAGTAEISDAEFQWYGTSQHLTEINGVLKLEGQNALVDNFNFLLNQTNISISGGLNNLIPYLTTDGEILEVNSLIYIPEFKLENWISSEEEARSVGMPNDIRLILHSKIDAFSYQSFHAEKIQGIIEAYQGTYSLSPLTMSIAGGEMHTDVLLSPKNDNGISMEA